MNTAKKLRIANIACVMLFLGGLATAAISRESSLKWLPIVGFVAVLVGMIGSIVIDNKRKELAEELQARMPIIIEQAKITGRRITHTYRPSGKWGGVSSTEACCLTFSTSRHGDVELSVPWDVWKQYPKGTGGQLQYQGARFISFKKR